MRPPSRWVIDPETGRTLNGKSRPFRSALFFYPKGASPRSCHRPDTEDRTTVRHNPAQSGTIRHGRRPSKPGNRPPRPHTIQSEQRGEGRNTPPTAATCRHPANKPRKTQAPRYRKVPAHNKDTDGRIRCPKSHPAENRRLKTVRRGPGGESSRTANGFPEGTVRLLLRTMPEGVRNRTPVGRFRG